MIRRDARIGAKENKGATDEQAIFGITVNEVDKEGTKNLQLKEGREKPSRWITLKETNKKGETVIHSK